MNRLKPISYQQLLRWLKRNKNRMTVFTMGGNSYIVVSLIVDGTICITGSNGSSIRIQEHEWEQAMEYIRGIEHDEDTWKSATYARPHILFPREATFTNFGPSFPAICKAYWAYHQK